MTSRFSHEALAHLLLLFVVLVWGATFVVVKAALREVSPLLFNLLRMAVATTVLLLLNRRHLASVTRRQAQSGALAGFFLAAGYQFQTVGLTLTTPAKSAFITGMVVVFVPALTLIPLFRPAGSARPGLLTAAGALSAFCGLLLLTTPPGTRLGSLFEAVGRGDLITLGCAIAFAAHLLTLARTARGIPAGVLATMQVGAATCFMALSVPSEHTHVRWTLGVIVALLVCGTLATAFAFTVQSYAQQHLPPTHTVVLFTLEPVFAWITSMIFLHESFGRRSLAGAALILAGILIIEFLPADTGRAAPGTEIPA